MSAPRRSAELLLQDKLASGDAFTLEIYSHGGGMDEVRLLELLTDGMVVQSMNTSRKAVVLFSGLASFRVVDELGDYL